MNLQAVPSTRSSWRTCQLGVDPCGEYGEFHSFAYAGPMFKASVPISAGEVVERDGFVFADFMLQETP